jgi:hypothetical protein
MRIINRVLTKSLRRRANHIHKAIVEKISSRPGNGRGLFRWRGWFSELRFVLKKNLPRRANHRPVSIVATIKARAEKSAAGVSFGVSRIGRRPHVRTLHLLSSPRRRQRAAVRAFFEHLCYPLAGARERDGTRRGKCPRPHAASIDGDRVLA